MSCCLESCVNNEKAEPPREDVTFYMIPKEYHLKQLWIEAIGIPEWQLRPNSEVCSAHFRELDFAISDAGERKLVDNAVPNLSLNTPEDLQALADCTTCRVCLGMDRKMHHIRDCNLHDMYEAVVGEMVEDEDGLPQMLCWECLNKVIAFRAFKEKAKKSQLLLSDKLAKNNILTVSVIKSINRVNCNLNSSLTLKYNETNEFDMTIDHDQLCLEQEVKIEFKNIKEEPTSEIIVSNIECKTEDSDTKDEPEHSSDSDSDDIDLSELRTRNARKRQATVETKEPDTNKKPLKKDEVKKKCEDTGKRAVKRGQPAKGPELSIFDTQRLSPEEQRAAVQARARSAAFLAAPHKCTVCYKGFRSADTLALHAVRHSEKCGRFECAVCRQRYRLARDLRLHAARNHAERYSCRECTFVTHCRRTAMDHQKWHAGNTYKCPHCPAVLGKFTSYMSHLRVKHSSRFSCELCGYTYVSRRGVQVHKARWHELQDSQTKLEGPYCEECKLRFANDEAYRRHLTQSSVHSSDNDPNRVRNEKSYPASAPRLRPPELPVLEIPCEQCGERQHSYTSYAKHFRAAHPDLIRTKFPRPTGNCMCDQCGRMFSTKTLLLDHKATHSGEKRYKCNACDKAFTNKKNLRAHQNVHGVQMSTYRCPFCERQFFHYQNCNRHVKTVHKGVKQFQCEICGKEFTSAAGQRAHVDHVHHKKPRPKRVRGRAPPAPAPAPAPAAYRHW